MRRRLLLGGAALLLLGACGGKDQPTPSNAGDLTLTFFQGSDQIGAMLLSITGGPVQSVTSTVAGLVVSSAPATVGATKIIVTGAIHTGDLLKVRVPDTTLATSYSVHIDQVADNLTFSLLDPTAHSATIHK